MKKRLDQLLVDLGLAPSKTKAQEMIELGQVRVEQLKISSVPNPDEAANSFKLKASLKIDPVEFNISVETSNITQYVARSGFKLASVLDELEFSVKNKIVLDIGQSTGGFTDCLLQRDAKHVIGLDVGEGQLSSKLINHPKVKSFEKFNAKDLDQSIDIPKHYFDLVVVDVSFISVRKILNASLTRLKPGGHLLALIKPQFEVGAVHISKGGIVKNQEAVDRSMEAVLEESKALGLIETQLLPSKIKGRDGNQEYFIFGKLKP